MVIDYIVRYNVNQFENVYNIKMMDVKNLFSFKALDKFMDDHQKNPDLFTELFEKKAKIL